MASIVKEIAVPSADAAWAALSDFGNAHRAFAGVLTDCTLTGEVRTVTFANGMVAQERLIGVDEARRRIAYAVVDGPFTHHSASFEVRTHADGSGQLVWASDLLPNALESMVEPLMQAGLAALARNLAAGRLEAA